MNSLHPTETVRIHLAANVSDEEIIALVVSVCGAQQAAMLAWLDGEDDDRERLTPKFDGTIYKRGAVPNARTPNGKSFGARNPPTTST